MKTALITGGSRGIGLGCAKALAATGHAIAINGIRAESEVAELLRRTEAAHETCQIGSYPFFREGRVGANFVVRSVSAEDLKACCDSLSEGLAAAGHGVTPGGI